MSRSVADTLRSAGATVFERGWLSANNILLRGGGPTALIDSGYASHSAQTLALLQGELGDQELELLLNTHLHSDHCGGNAALQQRYPGLQTLIPPGQAEHVRTWDEDALTYRATGQHCPRFECTGLLTPGHAIELGAHTWEIHGAKGHDPHSIVLFLRSERLLISADALWQNGFGVVFPELEGISAFDEVAETLDLIEALNPETVIPGHGAVFQDVSAALTRARSRLEQFRGNPEKHHRHALKVLVKFKLLEWREVQLSELYQWALKTPYLEQAMPRESDEREPWLLQLLQELERSGALELNGPRISDR